MSKRKILVLALSLCMVAILAVGGTLAYFTDTDSATNTFTVGGVKIELIEQQRDGKGGLENFVDGKKLYPIVGSAQDAKDKYGMPTAENYVDKIVTVKNLADDAWVRVYIAVPAKLENDDASKNVLHWNWGNKFTAAGNYDTTATPQPESNDWNTNVATSTNKNGYTKLTGTTTIDGIAYNVYYFNYNKILTKNEVTGSAFMIGCYLDKNVDTMQKTVTDSETGATTTKTVYTINGTEIDYDFTNGVKIPVFAVGVQAEGFDTCDDAMDSAFNANYNPFQ